MVAMGMGQVLLSFLFFVVFLALFVFPIVAIVDIARQPGFAFKIAGKSKGGWLAAVIVPLLLIPPVATVVGSVWYASGRAPIKAAQKSGIAQYQPST